MITKYAIAIAAGTAGAYFLAKPASKAIGLGGPLEPVGEALGEEVAFALVTGGVGAAIAVLVVK